MRIIKSFDYLKDYNKNKNKIQKAIIKVIESGQLILGDEVKNLEYNFSNFLNTPGYSIAVSSGTDAIIVALKALEIGAGDEVITVANTAVPTISAIRMTGATPVFCDVDIDSALIDLNKVKSLVTQKTKAILPVHLYGNLVDITNLKKIINNPNIFIIEDCAQAHGSLFQSQHAGTFGDISAFSFYPTKILGAYGDGGLCFTKNLKLAKKIKKIRTYGFDGRVYATEEGVNSRMDEIQAAILNVKIEYLQGDIQRRQVIAKNYDDNLNSNIKRFISTPRSKQSYYVYCVKVENRELIRDKLLHLGIQTGIHYPYPIHLMDAYNFLNYKEGSLPFTEKLCDTVLSLPIYPSLEDDEVNFICESLNQIIQNS
jgi:aminotransferase EvaB